MFKRNQAISQLPIGRFVNASSGAEVTSGTVTGTYSKDGIAGTLSGAISYDAVAREWRIDAISASEMDGEVIGLNFTLDGCLPIHYTIRTVSKTVADLNDAPAAPTVEQVRQELDANSTKLANLDVAVSSRSTLTAAQVWNATTRTLTNFSFQVTVGGYATGQDPAVRVDAASSQLQAIKARTDLIPVAGFPANFSALVVSAAGQVALDGSQAVPTTGNIPNTVFDCLNAARAQGFGKWVQTGTSLALYAPDGSTVVRQFTLDEPNYPTSRS